MAYTTIDKPDDYFNTITYTGDDVDGRTITGVGFQPDWVWVKARSNAFSHYIIDSQRYDSGSSKYLKLDSSSTAADETPSGAGWISQLNSDGYVCKNGTSNTNNCNENSVTYVAWNWLAGGTASSNTDGSITSSVSANTTSGFSIVTYTGNSTAGATVGHGLNQAPDMIIVKDRTNNIGNTNWNVYHSANTSAPETEIIALNSTSATSDSNIYWNDTAPTSTVFSLGTAGQVNHSSDDYVAYCFAEKKGYSKFGSYTGNGNADGTFVYTGFKPAFVIIKQSSAARDWIMVDNKRNTFNVVNNRLFPNSTDAQNTSVDALDFTSNGFKIRNTNTTVNVSGGTYIYMAFAENPFVTSTGICCTAR